LPPGCWDFSRDADQFLAKESSEKLRELRSSVTPSGLASQSSSVRKYHWRAIVDQSSARLRLWISDIFTSTFLVHGANSLTVVIRQI